MGHNVGEAAKRSTAKGMAGKKDERTHEQLQADAIKNLRGLRAAGGHVSPTDVDYLLSAYDFEKEQREIWQREFGKMVEIRDGFVVRVNALTEENASLQAKNEEFRAVYEAENRSTSVTVERMASTPAVFSAPYGADTKVTQITKEETMNGLEGKQENEF